MLVLGTAAFGFPYGIVNSIGEMTQKQVTQMVEVAWSYGIREFDTAQMYGNSEQFLGQAFKDLRIQNKVRVITKLHPELDYSNEDNVFKTVEKSLEILKIDKLYGLLLHRERFLENPNFILLLNRIKQLGLTEKIGASVYLPKYAEIALNTFVFDIVQFPSCILDRRFERAGVFKLAKKRNKEIYLRNIFLQGLLLQDSENCPIEVVRPELKKIENFLLDRELTKHELAIGYLKTIAPEAKLIFGAETSGQIQECVNAFLTPFSYELDRNIKDLFPNVSNEVLIPKNWMVK